MESAHRGKILLKKGKARANQTSIILGYSINNVVHYHSVVVHEDSSPFRIRFRDFDPILLGHNFCPNKSSTNKTAQLEKIPKNILKIIIHRVEPMMKVIKDGFLSLEGGIVSTRCKKIRHHQESESLKANFNNKVEEGKPSYDSFKKSTLQKSPCPIRISCPVGFLSDDNFSASNTINFEDP